MRSFRLTAEQPIETLAELHAFIEIAMQRWDRKAAQPSDLPLTPQVRLGLTRDRRVESITMLFEETEPERVFTPGS